eukprot:7750088-Heterocapsa_arctica.AAC.1
MHERMHVCMDTSSTMSTAAAAAAAIAANLINANTRIRYRANKCQVYKFELRRCLKCPYAV